MQRRKFLLDTTLGGFFILSGLSSCVSNEDKAVATKSIQSSSGGVSPFELEEITVAELQKSMESGEYTAKSITQMYLDRIAEVDQSGPELNSVIEVNPDALSIAETLDKERSEGKVRGPLHGIPILVKDNVDTGDKMQTTAGTLVLEGSIAPDDAFIIKQLREAGAVLLGKTNLSEWANFRSSRSSSGWSGRGRQTRNPYILDRNPCGSSAGSGVAVSANLCAIAIGTETNGSIVCPSSTNGVVGIKPTVGAWSRSGIIPISHTQDTAGPMGRTVTDAATLLGALTGVDSEDAVTSKSEGKVYKDYTQFLDANGLQGKKIGVLRSSMGFHEKVDKIMEEAFEAMKSQGAEIIDPVEIETSREYGRAGYQVLLYEFKDGVNKYLKGLGENAPVKSLKEVIAFNKANADRSMPYFQQEILEAAEEKGDLESKEYKDALEKVLKFSREEGIDAALAKYGIDAIIAPTGGPAWPIDVINGDHFGGGSSSLAARAGYPNITVPAGFINGLPVGISIFSGAYREPELIGMAYAFEQATKVRKAPKFIPTLKME
ncbi:amidase [Chondrinema litorale]|uniref:amidase n=1 Tax=Chondrinema litorale TaxID=2994555 RepID=UPI002543EEA2|nr:amidase [Chondrinema litorale]UZR99929.1 amidase [Chondrinema litorale]